MAYFEITFFKKNEQKENYEDNLHQVLLSIIYLFTLVAVCFVCVYKYYKYLLYRSYSFEGNFFLYSSIFREMLVEVVILFILPSKFLEDSEFERYNDYTDT